MSLGVKQTGQFAITVADTQEATAITGLDELSGVSFQAKFEYGSGGTNVKLYLQTSLDQGTTWIDIGCIVFTTADVVKVINFTNVPVLTPVVPTDGALADDTFVNGILGDRLRTKIISTGTYAGSTALTTRAVCR